MTAEQLQDALGLLPMDLIEEADALRRKPKKKPIPFRRWGALAACAVLMLGCGMFAMQMGLLRGKSAMDKAAMQECAPEAPAAPAEEECDCAESIILPDEENRLMPTIGTAPVRIDEVVYLRSDIPAVFTELLKSAEDAKAFCAGYNKDWFREFDLLLISLPGVASVSDLSVGQGSSPTHWEIRITEEEPAEDTLLILIPVQKGHIPMDAEFEVIWE